MTSKNNQERGSLAKLMHIGLKLQQHRMLGEGDARWLLRFAKEQRLVAIQLGKESTQHDVIVSEMRRAVDERVRKAVADVLPRARLGELLRGMRERAMYKEALQAYCDVAHETARVLQKLCKHGSANEVSRAMKEVLYVLEHSAYPEQSP